ncbi:MAG: outer membrane beta-barrel protein [Terriglobia bacterium]
MRSALRGAFMVACVSATLAAAQEVPKAELFGGYSFLQGDPRTTNGFTSQGWDAAVTSNVNRWLGVEVNFSDHYGTSAQDLEVLSVSPAAGPFAYTPRFTFLAGPHFSLRSASRVTPFVHALFGGVQGKATTLSTDVPCGPAISPCSVSKSQTAFDMEFGGGLDLKATRHISIRVIEGDYQRADFGGNPQNDVRISAGIVFTLGKR